MTSPFRPVSTSLALAGLIWVLAAAPPAAPTPTPTLPPMPGPLQLEPASVFREANRLYEIGRFGEAASQYEALAASGARTPALLYNLGTARLKAGHLGKAIAAFLEAEAAAPRDSELQANLATARARAGSTVTRPSYARWILRLSTNEWTTLAAGSAWLLLLTLALRAWRPSLRAVLARSTGVLAVLGLLSLAGLAFEWRERRGSVRAVVVVPETAARFGPLQESQTAFPLRDGAELRVLDRQQGWLFVSDGRNTGWVPARHVLEVKPS